MFVHAGLRLFRRQHIDFYPNPKDGHQIGARHTSQGILLNSWELTREETILDLLVLPAVQAIVQTVGQRRTLRCQPESAHGELLLRDTNQQYNR